MPISLSESPLTEPSRSKTLGRRKPRNLWLWGFTIFNAIALILLWWLENSVGEKTNPTSLLLYVPQHPLVLPTLFLLLASLWKLNFRLLACNSWIFCAWMFSFGGAQVAWPFWPSPRPTIRVVTWNVRRWELGPQEVPRQLRALSPDIICLCEAATPPPAREGAILPNSNPETLWNSQFPGWHVLQVEDVSILSRFPLLSSRVQPVEGGYGRQLIVASWQTPQGPLTTVATHVSTALKSGNPKPNNGYNQLGRWKEIALHAQATAKARAIQWPDIQNSVKDVSGPFLVAGDFNNPPRGLLYHRLARNWKDAFAQAGWGNGYTFPSSHPAMRIDYIWLSPSIQATRCFSPATRASDHMPVVTDISF